MSRTVTLTANAYRPSEALQAVKSELRRQGIAYTRSDVDRAQGEQLPDERVAIVVTRSSDGRLVPAHLRRTYRVTVTRTERT
jgi:hypothetical protein